MPLFQRVRLLGRVRESLFGERQRLAVAIMGFFDRQNLKNIRKLLEPEWPGLSIQQISSEYRSDNRDVLRIHIRGNTFLDLAENDNEWFSVVATNANGKWDAPESRRVLPLGVKAWASYQEVADGFSETISDLRLFTMKFPDMNGRDAQEYLDDLPEEEPEMPLSSTGSYSASSEKDLGSKKLPWGWIIGIGIALLLLLGSCQNNGWQMGRDGTGSRVQCEDGTWSNSGGHSGACSWHGGVK